MPNKFPHLRSTAEPWGLLEQLSFAVTQHPDEDVGFNGPGSWFGRLLLEGPGFLWEYFDDKDASLARFTKSDDLSNAYHLKNLRYTMYDWEIETMNITGSTGHVTGTVNIKGSFTPAGAAAIPQSGAHAYECDIVRGSGDRWRIKRWILRQKPEDTAAPPAPLAQVI